MAINITKLTSGTDVDGNSTAVYSSIAPTANNLLLLSISSRTSTGTGVEPTQPTVTGNGLTWVALGSSYYDFTSSSRKKLSVFRALGASPTAGGGTIDFAAQSQTDVLWVIDQVSGIDTSGANGAGAIVQTAGTIATGTMGTVTLAAFASSSNSTYGAFSDDSNPTTTVVVDTPGAGFTALGSAVSSMEMMTEWELANNTAVVINMGTVVGAVGGIAAELKIAPAVASTNVSWRNLMGVGQ